MIKRKEIYFHLEGDGVLQNKDEILETKIYKPRFSDNIHTFLWKLTSLLLRGSYLEYQLWRDDKLLSKAEVITWLPVFCFMPKKGIHIGPCRTVPEERGKGYYPYLLRQIINRDPTQDYYMIVNDNNLSSIKGVEKAGFRRFAWGIKTRMGRYVIKGAL